MEQFIQQLLRDQDVPEDLDPEVRVQLVSELTSRASDFLNARLIDAMSDETVEHFNTMLDDDSTTPEQVQNFITTNVSNKDQVIARALAEFRMLYLGDRA
jgi:hypothetical protein